MFLTLTLKNLKHMIKNNSILFLFILISQIISIIVVFAVTGMLDATTPQSEDERSEWQKSFNIKIADYSVSDADIFMITLFDKNGKCVFHGTNESEYEKINSLYKEVELYGIHDQMPVNYQTLPTYKSVKNKIKKTLDTAYNYLAYVTVSGYTDKSFFTKYNAFGGHKDFMKSYFPGLVEGEKNIEISITSGIETPFSGYNEGDTIKLNDTEYIISQINQTEQEEEYNNSINININDMDDNFIITKISILVSDDATQKQMGQLSDTIRAEFGDITGNIQDPQPEPLMEKQFNNMIYVVSFILMAVVLLNISRIYTYLLNRRKHTLSVYLICGANKFRIYLICIAEILLIMISAILCGNIIFRFILSDAISMLYPSFTGFFTADKYIMLSGIYLITGWGVMSVSIIPIIRKTAFSLSR